MRKIKRFSALIMAMVFTFSLFTVNVSAASEKYFKSWAYTVTKKDSQGYEEYYKASYAQYTKHEPNIIRAQIKLKLFGFVLSDTGVCESKKAQVKSTKPEFDYSKNPAGRSPFSTVKAYAYWGTTKNK